MVGLLFTQEISEGQIRLNEVLADRKRRSVQFTVRVLKSRQRGLEYRQEFFSVFPTFPVVPCSKGTFLGIRLHGQFGYILIGQKGIDAIGPIEVIHFLLYQFTAEFIAVDHFPSVTYDSTDSKNRPAAHNEQHKDDDTKTNEELLAQLQVLPDHCYPPLLTLA